MLSSLMSLVHNLHGLLHLHCYNPLILGLTGTVFDDVVN